MFNFFGEDRGGLHVCNLADVLLFACIAAYYTFILIAAATLLGSS